MSGFFNKNIINTEKSYQKEFVDFQNNIPLIGVYGVTSVGKSTFLNALLKSSEFKVGLGETTKQLHVIKNIEHKRHIDFKNISLPIEYISKDLAVLKNFSIVDVPGSNKSFSDEDIELIIKKLDVVIWIFDIHGDISERDVTFLKNVVSKNMVKTVVILNKIDSGMDDIDFNDDIEKKEFLEDVKSRQKSIFDLFKREHSEGLLVTILPMSARKLFSGITKNRKEKFEQQHKIMEEILITTSKSSLMQKEVFRDGYDKVKKIAIEEIYSYEESVLRQKRRTLEDTLNKINDKDILSASFNQNKLLDKNLPTFNIECRCKYELSKINKKIEEKI